MNRKNIFLLCIKKDKHELNKKYSFVIEDHVFDMEVKIPVFSSGISSIGTAIITMDGNKDNEAVMHKNVNEIDEWIKNANRSYLYTYPLNRLIMSDDEINKKVQSIVDKCIEG